MAKTRIAQVTDAYTRLYRDSGQFTAYVEWLDTRGTSGRTEGDPNGLHLQALFRRAVEEGVNIRNEVW